MSKFTDCVKESTPRLVVLFRRADNGDEQFQWGVVGRIPILTLVGYITRVQAELAFRAPDPCDQPALVIAWDAEKQEAAYFVHPDIPVDPLVGMLEAIKAVLIGSHAAQRVTSHKGAILGPDGSPI